MSENFRRANNHPSAVKGAELDLPREDILIVFKGNVRVGFLHRQPHRIVFNYSQQAIKRGMFLSESMKENVEYSGRDSNVPPFFANLLPEGSRLEEIASSLGVSPKNEFELLAVLGKDTVGDVTIMAADAKSHPHIPRTSVNEFKEDDIEVLLKASSDVSSDLFDPTALPGVQKKISRILKALTHNSPSSGNRAKIFTHMMFKSSDDYYPKMVENERHIMYLAKLCGINVPNNLVLTDREGKSVYVIERFDRLHREGLPDRRIHVEDGCQLLGKRPEEKYNSSFEKLTKAALGAVDDKQRAVKELLTLYIYSYAVGNGDMHLKNVSIWENPNTGEIELSPAYDLLTTHPYGDKKQVSLAMDGKKANFKPGTFYNYGKRFGLERQEVDEILESVISVVEREVKSGNLSLMGLGEQKTKSLEKFITERLNGMKPRSIQPKSAGL